MDALLEAIVEDDRAKVEELLRADAKIAAQLIEEARLYESKVFHRIYVRDTALHLDAAGYRVEIVRRLLASGADPNEARTHRHSSPLHHAADGDGGGGELYYLGWKNELFSASRLGVCSHGRSHCGSRSHV